MVVSLVPNFNRALFESLEKASPGTPLVTILTDFADYPPHFWMEKQAQYLICGTDKAAEQARATGYDIGSRFPHKRDDIRGPRSIKSKPRSENGERKARD